MKIIFLLLFFSFTFNHGLKSLKTKIKVVNFKTREINRGTYKLIWTLALIIIIIIIKARQTPHITDLPNKGFGCEFPKALRIHS
jgi:hypothetical protein